MILDRSPAGREYRLSIAVRAAMRGYYVFPVNVRINTTGDKDVRPVARWREASTTNLDTIDGWWGPDGTHPHAVPAVDCGRSGIIVVDCDVKHTHQCTSGCRSGVERWAPHAAGAPVIATPSGGRHYLYHATPGSGHVTVDNTGKLDTHVDVRGDGGFAFCWDHYPARRALPAVPDRVVGAFAPPATGPAGAGLAPAGPRASGPGPGAGDSAGPLPGPRAGRREFTAAEAERFVAPALDALRSAPRGAINGRLNAAATQLSHFVPEFVSRDAATSLLLDAQRHAWVASGGADDGDYRAALTTIASGLDQHSDPWRAVRRPELDAPTLVSGPAPDTDGAPATVVPLGDPSPDPFAGRVADELLRLRVRHAAEQMWAREQAAAPADEMTTMALMQHLVMSSQDLDDIPEPDPLIRDWLYRDTINRMVGASGSYKTFAALDMALAVATGQSWHGYETSKSRVLYVAAEGVSGVRKRVRAWERRFNNGIPIDNVTFLPRAVNVMDAEWFSLVEIVKNLGYGFVILDTQARITSGLNENDATESGLAIERIERLRRETGACVMLVHHTGHTTDRGRGSSAWYAAETTELLVKKPANRQMSIEQVKQKDSEQFGIHSFRMAVQDDSLVIENIDSADSAPATQDTRMLARLRDTLTSENPAWRNILEYFAELGIGEGCEGLTRADVQAGMHAATGARPHRTTVTRAWNALGASGDLIPAGDGTVRRVISRQGLERIGRDWPLPEPQFEPAPEPGPPGDQWPSAGPAPGPGGALARELVEFGPSPAGDGLPSVRPPWEP